MPITVIGNAYNYYSTPGERILLLLLLHVEVVGIFDMLKNKIARLGLLLHW